MSENDWKAEFNLRAKASMREYLRSKSWSEKVRSIERMNIAMKSAQLGMRESLRKEEDARANT